jgi:hypothetical protein
VLFRRRSTLDIYMFFAIRVEDYGAIKLYDDRCYGVTAL